MVKENKPINKTDKLPKTFLIRIIHNKNNSWQGTISSPGWPEPIPFRSSLDLMKLIENNIILTKPENEK